MSDAGSFQRWREACRSLLPFARRHRRGLWLGASMALLVIGIRLSLPWLFRAMLEPLLGGATPAREATELLQRPLSYGVLFLLLLVALGFSDFLMRLKFAQFAIGTVRDLRAKAFQSAMQIDPRIRPSGPGDLVARLIGDTARIKEGLKGFLVHVATNGLMLAGASAVLLWVDLPLGLIFAAAFALIGAVVVYGATRVYRRALRFRSKEGKLAESIHRACRGDAAELSFADVNRSSGKHEATVTRLQGRTTWAVHVLFGVAILCLVWLGMRAVAAGSLAGADFLMFILYALMTRAPVVQLARQGTRTGKILACADRLEQVLRTGRRQESALPLPPLLRQVRVAEAKVYRPASQGGGRRLGIDELRVHAGSRVAVLGPSGSGKSTLLQLLAGTLVPERGEVWWDDVALVDVSRRSRQERIAFLPQETRWPKQPLWNLLGLPEPAVTPETRRALKACGARDLIRRLPRGLETEVASERLSVSERRALLMTRVFLMRASLVLLDEPFAGLSRSLARRRLQALLARHREAALVVALDRLPSKKAFDRVLVLRNGKLCFDGSPFDYSARPAAASAGPGTHASGPSEPSLNGASA